MNAIPLYAVKFNIIVNGKVVPHSIVSDMKLTSSQIKKIWRTASDFHYDKFLPDEEK